MQWIKCCEERIEKFEALMDKPPQNRQLKEDQSLKSPGLKSVCVRFMLITLSKAFKMPAKILKIHGNLWC